MFLEQLLNGVTLGGIYALIALGYTLVYSILFMINFAHSEFFMLGAFFGLWAAQLGSGNLARLLYALIATFFLSGLVGVLTERLAYRPLRYAPRLVPLISAIGVSILLQNIVMVGVTPQSVSFPALFPEGEVRIAGVRITYLQLFILSICAVLLLFLQLFIQKTTAGQAIRACSQDLEAASLCGININRIIAMTFFLGAALGGVAGLLVGMYYQSIKYNMGFLYGIKAFTAAVLGGIGNVPGAMLGGFVLGILESLGAAYVSSTYKDVFAFIILIGILLIRPTGILGERVAEKV